MYYNRTSNERIRPSSPRPDPSSHYVTCGRSGYCGDSPTHVKVDTDVADVRCCSDLNVNHFYQKSGSQYSQNGYMWSRSDYPGGCASSVTFDVAAQTCHDRDARLCTVGELVSDAASGTGCSFDSTLVWTSTPGPDHAFAPTDTDYELRSVAACPDYCFDSSNQIRAHDPSHLHQLSLISDGFVDNCDPLVGLNESRTDCQGRKLPEFGDVSKYPVFR